MLEQTLIPPDLSQEEAIFRILNSTEQFIKNANTVFDRLEQRAASVDQQYRETEARADRIREKLASLQTLDKAIVLRAPSQFPFAQYEPATKIFPAVRGCLGISSAGDGQHSAIPNARLPVDMKRELEERKHMFVPSQIVDQRKSSNKKRIVPSSVNSVCELFVHDSLEPAYSDVGGETIGKKQTHSRSIVSRKEREVEYGIDEPALVSAFGASNPFEYTPDLGTVHEPDLPDTLPNLPGVAIDVTLADFFVTSSMLPDIPDSVRSESPAVAPTPPANGSDVNIVSISAKSVDSEKQDIKVERLEIVNTVQSTISSTIPPDLPKVAPPPASGPPPPPPPPPPPSMGSVQTPSGDAGRSDLLAAIRAAGGAGQAKLKSVKTTTKQRRTNATLQEASALSVSSSSGAQGGDLMSSLAKALDARRKAISGKQGGDPSSPSTGRVSSTLGRISELIPEPPSDMRHDNAGSDNEDWS